MRRYRGQWRRFGRRVDDPNKAIYLIPADPSLGSGFDPAAAHLLRLDLTQLDPMERTRPLIIQDAVLYDQIEPDLFASLLYEASEHHRRARIACEDNGVGIHVVGTLSRLRAKQVMRRHYDPLRRASSLRPGFHTDVSTKPTIRATLRRAIAEGLVEVQDRETAEDLRHILIGEAKSGELQATTARGSSDHLEMALAIGVHILLSENVKAWYRPAQTEGEDRDRKVVPMRKKRTNRSTWDIKPGRERWA